MVSGIDDNTFAIYHFVGTDYIPR